MAASPPFHGISRCQTKEGFPHLGGINKSPREVYTVKLAALRVEGGLPCRCAAMSRVLEILGRRLRTGSNRNRGSLEGRTPPGTDVPVFGEHDKSLFLGNAGLERRERWGAQRSRPLTMGPNYIRYLTPRVGEIPFFFFVKFPI